MYVSGNLLRVNHVPVGTMLNAGTHRDDKGQHLHLSSSHYNTGYVIQKAITLYQNITESTKCYGIIEQGPRTSCLGWESKGSLPGLA